jgi:two-component system sensor histidine kinase DctS
MKSVLPPSADLETRPWKGRRLLLWALLVLLLVVAQSLLVWMTVAYESNRAQEQAEAAANDAAADLRRSLLLATQDLQTLTWSEATRADWAERALARMRARREIAHVERRDAALKVIELADSPYGAHLFAHMARAELEVETAAACADARRTAAPSFSRSYFVPMEGGAGQEVMDLCLPAPSTGRDAGFVVATLSLPQLLDSAFVEGGLRRYELSIVGGDGARLARAGVQRGKGVFVAEHLIALPGQSLQLRANSTAQRPSLIPNLSVALVLGLSMALFVVVLMLARDVRRRARAERALAEALGLRKAMEDSLSTGLRARDLQGRITYVNPAFCAMVGFDAGEIVGAAVPPYWPPERVDENSVRHKARLAAPGSASRAEGPAREGFETVFMRRGGERFPVMIYEAPLVDGAGRQTGWMSAVLDVSQQRKVEELSRQQQERLQASARLSMVGEMASLLSHELNQPLSAIASYATGSLNLLDVPDAQTPQMLQQALARIAEQAERAGRVIKSVHDFVRRREQHHEAIGADRLFEAVLPLVRLQARKSGTRIEIDLPQSAPQVRCDGTMVEQVLLNLARNGIQAMEGDTPPAQRVLVLSARRTHERWVTFSVVDAGAGIAPDVATRLFTPFFSTRAEGMGLGLSLCRTVIEQHGGALDFDSPWPAGSKGGTRFRFTLAAVGAASRTPSIPSLPSAHPAQPESNA